MFVILDGEAQFTIDGRHRSCQRTSGRHLPDLATHTRFTTPVRSLFSG
jgi:hypothetical protein